MLPVLGAFIASFTLLLILLKTPLANWILDHPNHRSLHTRLTPRSGGLAIMGSVLFTWLSMGQSCFWIFPVTALLGVSIVDDIQNLSIRWRFSFQVLVCAGFVFYLFPHHPWWILMMLIISLTWMINLYNFMDGADGMAGGMALIGFSTYAIAAYFAQDFQIALMSGSIAAASLAFLFFNFHPAQIFMGDSGSISLGFLAGSLGLYGWQHDLWPIWFPILVFSPFIVDATLTLFKRLVRGEKFWQAHRSHYYQRLVQIGVGHKATAIYEYILMIAVGSTALFLMDEDYKEVGIGIFVWILIYAAVLIFIDQRWKQYIQLNTNPLK